MSCRYWLHEKIQRDITEGYEWYEDKLDGLGLAFLTAVKDKIEEVTNYPENFGSKGNPGYREASVNRFPYVIVYRFYKRKKEYLSAPFIIPKKHPEKNTGGLN